VGPPALPTRRPNDGLAVKCGLRVMLVLDESSSINATDAGHIRTAANAFVAGLKDTGTQLAITAFAITARNLVSYQEISNTTEPTFTTAINNNFIDQSPGRAGTNWTDAFNLVRQLDGNTPANLVVFMTDGDPNLPLPFGVPTGNSATQFDVAIGPSIEAANAVKAAGSHVFVVGVGAAVSSQASVNRLKQISGDNEFPVPHADFGTADLTRVIDFDGLKNTLNTVVARMCGGSLIITKEVSAPPGVDAETARWTFTATLTPPPGHAWLSPKPPAPTPDTAPSVSEPTNTDGKAEFHWKLTGPGNAKLTVVKETEKPGYHLVLATCRAVDEHGDETGREVHTTGTTIASDLVVPPMGHATCDVLNTRTMAHLTIIKKLRPPGDPGLFDLLVNGAPVRQNVGTPGGSTGRLPLPTDTYHVGERVSANSPTTLADYDTSTTCVNFNGTRPRPTVSGVGTETDPVSVKLTSATDNWVCWITNISNRFGNLTVIKHLVPSNAPGAFDLIVNNTPEKTGARDGDRAELTHIAFGDYTVGEAVSAGQTVTLADYEISISCVNESTDSAAELPGFPVTGHEASVTLGRGQSDIVCTITNVHIPTPVAHLEVVKQLVPSQDGGLFNLRVNGITEAPGVGDGGSTGPLEFELGTHKVSESAAAGTDLANYDVSTTCVNATTGEKVHGVGTESEPVSVTLNHVTDNWECTITNTLKAPPTEPGGGGEEPDLCNDTDNGIDVCGDVAAAPHLFVIKQMPAHARVGERVPITITVMNTGRETARQVTLHETPPPGGRIVGVADHGSLQSDGTVIWNLGNLGPGEKRTVRATMLITQTGSHTDTAVASASNADPAFDVATVRARAAAHPPPPPIPPPPIVTG
jgi:uncharacterized repeat protein (TIGR01451 family)